MPSNSILWFEENQDFAIPISGFNPDYVNLNIQDTGIAGKDQQLVIKDKKTVKKIIVDEIKENDILNHNSLGELKVTKIEVCESIKAVFYCRMRKNGIDGNKDDDELILVRDDMEQCFINNASEVNILVKIHTHQFSYTISTSIPITS